MFDEQRMMYIYVETPLHAGSGRAVGVVDLPIQRERVTGYPLVQSSGIKGRLRAEAKARGLDDATIAAIFGPDKVDADSNAYAGAASFGDARILLFPVQSLYGVFAYVTSANVLARLARDLAAIGVENKGLSAAIAALDKDKDKETAYAGSMVAKNKTLVLEEFSYTDCEDVPGTIADFLKSALPTGPEYAYWRDSLANRLVILPEDDFRDFVTGSTEVVTRTRLDPNTKTVASGALWTEESLPSDTLLYCPLAMGKERKGEEQRKKDNDGKERNAATAKSLMDTLSKAMNGQRIRLGGDETVGRGCVALHFGEGSSDGK